MSHSVCLPFLMPTCNRKLLWGANTFPTCNRLPNPYFGLQTILVLVFLWFSLVNYGGDSNSQVQIFLKLNNFFYRSVIILVVTA